MYRVQNVPAKKEKMYPVQNVPKERIYSIEIIKGIHIKYYNSIS